ncbi:DUF3159 domain-containing protein [Streptomyces sp. NBC_01456]|uniref:DUF3159 domain-containing protein n=1 Tax=unclassified Streptomyces TaxID=2593676 RepID=UPI002E31FF56|nr:MULTISPECIES: DUF3159 domain-containing protein [unclassified Streptomyces]
MAPEPHHADEDADALRAAARERLRAAVVDVAPVFGFTVSFALTHRLALALTLAFTAGAGVSIYRLVRRKPAWRALTVLGLVCVQGAVAARTGEATDFFLPSLILHGATVTANAVMLLLRWPLMGVAVGLVTKEGTGWRRCTVRRRAYAHGSLVVLGSGLVTLTVQLSLYLSDQAIVLGFFDSVGPLVLALSVLLGWRVYRHSLGTHRCDTHDPMNAPSTTSLPLERTLP